MKKIVLMGAFALLAACGSSSGVSVSTSGSKATTPAAGSSAGGSASSNTSAASGDTIPINNLGDMPPQCIKLLSTFLKQIEPIVSKVDWTKATLADFEALGTQFTTESTSFDTQSKSAGCDKYNITGSSDNQLKQVIALAKADAPGTVKFLTFMSSLATSSSGSGASVPGDCTGTIAAIEPYLAKGKTMKNLPMSDLTKFGQLMTAVGTSCSAAEAQAFYARADVKAFIAG